MYSSFCHRLPSPILQSLPSTKPSKKLEGKEQGPQHTEHGVKKAFSGQPGPAVILFTCFLILNLIFFFF
jgi:hypothetical protein